MSNSTVYINGQPRGNSTYVIRKDRLIKAKERMEQRENKGSDEEYIENLKEEKIKLENLRRINNG